MQGLQVSIQRKHELKILFFPYKYMACFKRNFHFTFRKKFFLDRVGSECSQLC